MRSERSESWEVVRTGSDLETFLWRRFCRVFNIPPEGDIEIEDIM